MSFWKHEPPKPTDAFRNFGPMRESLPIAFATSSTSAPVASQSAEIELIDEMRCARNALATSFESSDDHRFVDDDPLARHPVRVDIGQRLDRRFAAGGAFTANKHAVRRNE